MVDIMVFVECQYLVCQDNGLSISSSIMEYRLVVSKSFSRSTTRSGPRKSTLDSPLLNEIISISKVLSSSSLFISLSMTCKKVGVNNRAANLCVMNGICVCVYGTCMCVGLCVGNDRICLGVCSVLHDLSFSQGPRKNRKDW